MLHTKRIIINFSYYSRIKFCAKSVIPNNLQRVVFLGFLLNMLISFFLSKQLLYFYTKIRIKL
jgi:hypothetical protein